MTEEPTAFARARVLGQLDILYETLRYLDQRKIQLESALKDLDKIDEDAKWVNSFTFSAYPAADSGPGHFLTERLLGGIQAKHPDFDFKVIEKDGLIREIRWTKDDEHTKEVLNAAKWTEARAREQDAKKGLRC
jgi:hypothetical protein